MGEKNQSPDESGLINIGVTKDPFSHELIRTFVLPKTSLRKLVFSRDSLAGFLIEAAVELSDLDHRCSASSPVVEESREQGGKRRPIGIPLWGSG